ncbi:hypothetical protein Celaphus_00000590 [Cervus elaphus hippelaphus]|uniref:SPATA31 domain-containing protein n=1 Tax=Cervus elaphus hippelaphus TaxID=46360 RepID=A0A212DAM4_CEREH|nr:hypothetical protein Celaphus_00000590 [Cervus elaphus hippelaphus]
MEAQAQPQSLNPNTPQCQPQSWAHMGTQARPQALNPSMPHSGSYADQAPTLTLDNNKGQTSITTTLGSHGGPDATPNLYSNHAPRSSMTLGSTRYQDVSGPIVQNKAQYFIPKAIHTLEHHCLQKQVERKQVFPAHTSVSIFPGDLISPEVWEKLEHHISKRFMEQESSLPCRIQASQRLMQSQDQFPRPCQAQGREGPSSASAGLGKRSEDAQKMRSKCPARILPGQTYAMM